MIKICVESRALSSCKRGGLIIFCFHNKGGLLEGGLKERGGLIEKLLYSLVETWVGVVTK